MGQAATWDTCNLNSAGMPDLNPGYSVSNVTFLLMSLRKHPIMDQILESPPPKQETGMGFLVLGCSLAHLWLWQAFGEWSSWWKILSLAFFPIFPHSLPLCKSCLSINKYLNNINTNMKRRLFKWGAEILRLKEFGTFFLDIVIPEIIKNSATFYIMCSGSS